MEPEISVLICTWNRAADLKGALECLESQSLPKDRFEVVVVDNNSTDSTREAVEEARGRVGYDLVYVFEPQQGKSRALNAGIATARADLIACTDDDCRPEPMWLQEIASAFADPEVAVLGGPGLSVYPDSIKSDPHRVFLATRFLGDHAPCAEFTELREHDPPLGLNMSFRKRVAEEVGGFDVSLGPTGKRHLCREETAFVRKAQALGHRVFYSPKPVVRHHIQEERITWKSIRKQAFDSGIGTFRERYADAVGRSALKRLVFTLQFGAELVYAHLRMVVFVLSRRRRTIARFRGVAASGKLAGLWSG